MSKEKEILIAAVQARKILHIHGFISDKEALNIFLKIHNYQNRFQIEVTQEELQKTNNETK